MSQRFDPVDEICDDLVDRLLDGGQHQPQMTDAVQAQPTGKQQAQEVEWPDSTERPECDFGSSLTSVKIGDWASI